MTKENTLLVWLVAAVLILALVNVGYSVAVNSNLKVGVSQSELKSAIDGIEFPEYQVPEVNLSGIEERLDSLELEVAEFSNEDVSEEAEAERLVLAELDSRDFKKAIVVALNVYYNGSFEVESHRHITDIVVKDLDVDYADEEANVTVEVKVYYYVDGDEDEDEKARFEEFTVLVTDLDEDDDYIDAEVDDSYLDTLEVNKVY